MGKAGAPVVAFWLLVSALRLGAAEPAPVAIIYGLSGEAWIKASPADARRPVQRFEWLSAAVDLEVAPGATLLLAFATGTRYELGGGSRATLSPAGGFQATAGPVRVLPSVSPLPRFEPLAAETRPGGRAGALRIRGTRIRGLYPREDASVLADQTVLSFEPPSGISRYKVQVEDEIGNAVFDAEVRTPSVVVSPGVLKPGGRYHWTVRGLGGPTSARGEAEFSVLPPDRLASREALRRSLEGLGRCRVPGHARRSRSPARPSARGARRVARGACKGARRSRAASRRGEARKAACGRRSGCRALACWPWPSRSPCSVAPGAVPSPPSDDLQDAIGRGDAIAAVRLARGMASVESAPDGDRLVLAARLEKLAERVGDLPGPEVSASLPLAMAACTVCSVFSMSARTSSSCSALGSFFSRISA